MVGIQDTFISDDDDDLCPLCIEEMDISDKNFKPCPCGYQICQFCYNNIRQNPELNGLCPACRRKYDDESVEYKKISAEEWKRDHLRQARKEKERKQREREKRETEQQASKKHLAGMRVIQKNLVYVIGLNPNIPTDELHNTLRQEQFFGQYGKIHKIVINKRTNASGNPGIGVYVTFARKEDAARCIAAVDGSINDGKYLRAAYGTTKYCSAYLRGQTCPNPNCMFLHEPGEEADSYTRRDLSAMQHRQNRATPNQTMPSLSAATAAYRSSPAPQSPAPSAPALAPSAPSAASSLPPMSASSGAVPAPVPTPSPAPSLPALASSAVPLVPLPSNVPVSSPLPSAAGVAPSPAVAGPWGKVAVTAPRPTEEPEQPMALRNLTKCLEVLSKGAVNFSFSSFLISQEDLETHPIPPYFTFSLTSETRQQAYDEATKALAQHREVLLKDVSAQQPQEPARHEQQTPVSASPRSSSKTATPPGLLVSSPSNAQNAQNSHELLAHLLKGKGSPQPATQPAPVVQPAAAPQITSQLLNRLNRQLDRHLSDDPEQKARDAAVEHMAAMLGQFASTKRKLPEAGVGAPADIDALGRGQLPASEYVDDGPLFDVHNLPEDAVVGDCAPSVWSAIEERNRVSAQLNASTQAFANAQTRARRVLDKVM